MSGRARSVTIRVAPGWEADRDGQTISRGHAVGGDDEDASVDDGRRVPRDRAAKRGPVTDPDRSRGCGVPVCVVALGVRVGVPAGSRGHVPQRHPATAPAWPAPARARRRRRLPPSTSGRRRRLPLRSAPQSPDPDADDAAQDPTVVAAAAIPTTRIIRRGVCRRIHLRPGATSAILTRQNYTSSLRSEQVLEHRHRSGGNFFIGKEPAAEL